MYSSKIVADSVWDAGIRLTSIEAEYPSLFHAELVSNRDLSITADGGNLQRPISTTRALITGTNNAFARAIGRYCTGNGAPTLLASLFEQIRAQLATHRPADLAYGDWHLPYITRDTVEDACLVAIDKHTHMDSREHHIATTMICRALSVVRCHMVEERVPQWPRTRENHERLMAYYVNENDIYGQLLAWLPMKGSAFEHQATPDKVDADGAFDAPQYHGNIRGWQQHRMMFIEAPLLQPNVTQEQQANG